MHRRILLIAAALLIATPACAEEPAYQGYSGHASAASIIPSPHPDLHPASVPKVSEPVPPAAPQVLAPVPVVAAQPAAAPPVDVCAAYMASYQAYVMCQDRMQKIQRMKDAVKSRQDALNPPPQKQADLPPATTPVSAPAPQK